MPVLAKGTGEIDELLAAKSGKSTNHSIATSVRATAIVQIFGFTHLTDAGYITGTTWVVSAKNAC